MHWTNRRVPYMGYVVLLSTNAYAHEHAIHTSTNQCPDATIWGKSASCITTTFPGTTSVTGALFRLPCTFLSLSILSPSLACRVSERSEFSLCTSTIKKHAHRKTETASRVHTFIMVARCDIAFKRPTIPIFNYPRNKLVQHLVSIPIEHTYNQWVT
jgi:hypothetical protein